MPINWSASHCHHPCQHLHHCCISGQTLIALGVVWLDWFPELSSQWWSMSTKASGCRYCSSKFDDIRSCATLVEGCILVVVCINLRQYVGCNLCDLCCDASIVVNAHTNVSQQLLVELLSLQSIFVNNHEFLPILSNSLQLSSRPIAIIHVVSGKHPPEKSLIWNNSSLQRHQDAWMIRYWSWTQLKRIRQYWWEFMIIHEY